MVEVNYFANFIHTLAKDEFEIQRIINVTMSFIENGFLKRKEADTILAEYDIYLPVQCKHCKMNVMPIYYAEGLYCSGTCENCASGTEKCPACRKKPETKN